MANSAYGSPHFWGGTGSSFGYGDLSSLTPPPMWQETINKYPSLYPGFGPVGGAGTYGAPSSAWGSFSPTSPTTPTGGGGVPGVPGAQLLQTDKFPAANASLDAVLGRVNSDGTGLISSTKDPAQAARAGAAGADYTGATTQQNQTLADFTRNFLAADPAAKAMTDAQTGALGKWYGTGADSVQGSLNKLASQRWQAIQASLARALGQAQRGTNIARLGMGGNSAYANAQFADAAAGIMANAAGSQADLNRNNYLAVLQGQSANAGVPQGLLNSYLTRDLTPIQAQLQTQSGQLSNLGMLGNIGTANTLYQTPQQLDAATIANINAILAGKNAANISGVGANYQTPSFPTIPRLGSFGSGGYGSPPGMTFDGSTGLPVSSPSTLTGAGDINPSTGQPWVIPPSQLGSYMTPTMPSYQSNAGSGQAIVEDNAYQYVPGMGMVPQPMYSQPFAPGFFSPRDYGQPVVTETGGEGE